MVISSTIVVVLNNDSEKNCIRTYLLSKTCFVTNTLLLSYWSLWIPCF